MHYIEAFDRDQMMMTTWDSMVDPGSTARLIDAFVNSLDFLEYGVKDMASEGRPSYDPKSLYKLYIRERQWDQIFQKACEELQGEHRSQMDAGWC